VTRALLRRAFLGLTGYDFEKEKIVAFVQRAARNGRRILDVGCGRGRLMRPLAQSGLDVMGVDANPELVRRNRADGLRCQTVEEHDGGSDRYDVILMSHVIEHFAPEGLVAFLDRYLDRLAPGGALVVATPLLSPYFHEDLDHVRPYPPGSLAMAFAPGVPQTRHRPRNRLELRDVWFRRGHWRPAYGRARFVRSWHTAPLVAVEAASALLFRASAGFLGRTDGWVGMFEKVEPEAPKIRDAGRMGAP
jgi:SAM-dependent methyltransferase